MVKHLESKSIFEIEYTAPGDNAEFIKTGYVIAEGIVHAINEVSSLASVNHLISIKESDVRLWIPSLNSEAKVSFTVEIDSGYSVIIPIYNSENIEGELAKDLRELENKLQCSIISVERSERPILIVR